MLDSLIVAEVDVTSMDGTIVSYKNVVLFQMANGDLFFTNSGFAGTDIATGKGGIQSMTVTSITASACTGLYQNALQDFVCLAAGTRVQMERGDVPIEEIEPGDLVVTADHGLQPVIWVGARTIRRDPSRRQAVAIAAGQMGHGLPLRGLVLSPQHRVLVRSRIAERLFETDEVLMTACHLGFEGPAWSPSDTHLTWYHLLCPAHEVIFAEGCPVETLMLGSQAIAALTPMQLMQIAAQSSHIGQDMTPARKIASGRARTELAVRHHRNRQPFLQNVTAPVG